MEGKIHIFSNRCVDAYRLPPLLKEYIHVYMHTPISALPLFVFYVCIEYGSTYIHRASLIAQSVKSLPAMQETQVQFLDWEDPLKK